MVDESERIREFLNNQYVKMKRMAAVGSLLLLAANLALTTYPYIQERFPTTIFGIPRTWIGVPLVFLLTVLLIWLGAHIYVRIFEMYRMESKADLLYSPYSIYAFGPRDEMMFRDVFLPMMYSECKLLPEGEEKEIMKKKIKVVEGWAEKGFIPKEDFPEHLREMYLTDKQKRL